MEREQREFTLEGRRWSASVARRGASGHALVYFLPLEDGEPAEDDRGDRRSALEPGTRLSGLDADELRDRLRGGTALTGTERRFRAPDGRLWLAQNEGPVWVEGDVAEGLTGVVFTSLEGAPERLVVRGGHVGRMAASELCGLWRTADTDEADDGGGRGTDGHGAGRAPEAAN